MLRVIGWCGVWAGLALLIGAVPGEGSGDSHDPGAGTIRTLLFERAYGVAALVTMAGGVVMAGIGRLLRDVG